MRNFPDGSAPIGLPVALPAPRFTANVILSDPTQLLASLLRHSQPTPRQARETRMKTFLAVAAALGLSLSAASACPMKRDTTASVDKGTVASVKAPVQAPVSTPADATTTKEKAG